MFRFVSAIALPILCASTIWLPSNSAQAEDKSISATKSPVKKELPVVHREDFEDGLKAWVTTDDSVWKVIEIDRKGVLVLAPDN